MDAANTNSDVAREAEDIIEQMLKAEAAPEPGTLKPRDILSREIDDLPIPTVVSALTSAGYVYVYDTVTHERSLINRNMLPVQMRKKREDGKPVFTTKSPGIKPKRGVFKCLLHPEGPNREYYDSIGLQVCPKSNLMNEFQVRMHMLHRHPQEYAVMQEEEKRKEATVERKWKELLLEKSSDLSPDEHRSPGRPRKNAIADATQ